MTEFNGWDQFVICQRATPGLEERLISVTARDLTKERESRWVSEIRIQFSEPPVRGTPQKNWQI